MKKASLLSIFLTLALTLAACGGTSSRTNGFRNGGAVAELTPETKLAIGTIKLEGTAQAVNSQEAAQLLPLWQLMSELYSNDAAAPQEFTAVVDQIQSTMKPAQVQAINNMSLTGRDMFTAFQDQGGATGNMPGGGTAGSGSSGSNRGGRGGGGFVFAGGGPGGGGFRGGGDFPGDGGFGNRQQGNSSSQSGSGFSAQNAQSFQNTAGKLIVDQVIQLLQGKMKS